MELAFKASSLAAAGSFLLLVVLILQLLSCAFVSSEVNDVKDNKPFKIYWALNFTLQLTGTGLGAIGLYVVYLISK